MTEYFQTAEKFARNFIRLNAKEVLDLGAGNNYGNAVGETDHHGARYKLDHRTHAGGAQDHKEYAPSACTGRGHPTRIWLRFHRRPPQMLRLDLRFALWSLPKTKSGIPPQ